MSYVVAAISLALYYVLRKRLSGKFNGKLWFVPPALLFMTTCSLANTELGGWFARKIVGGLLGLLSHPFGISTSIVAGGLCLILLVGAGFDLWDKKPEGLAKTAIIMLPLLVIIAAGPVASSTAGLFDTVSNVGNSGISTMIGG